MPNKSNFAFLKVFW